MRTSISSTMGQPVTFALSRLRIVLLIVTVVLATVGSATTATAHWHFVTTGNGEIVYIAGEQNHNRFVLQADGTYLSCDTTPLPDTGPAGYGLETAHHGPDTGTPGKGDGCYQMDGHPTDENFDTNPAID